MSKRTALAALAAAALLASCAAGVAAPIKPAPCGCGWVNLFNDRDLSGWHVRHEDARNGWFVKYGWLINTMPSTDLISDTLMGDHQLHVEFRVPKGGNSGVYLQGRYEIQVHDSYGGDLHAGMCGAIYSKVVPKKNACRPANRWQSFDVTFRQARLDANGKVVKKARVTVYQNGELIIDNAEIDGVTGSALDDKEGQPGPLYLQGDHTAVEYRHIRYRPLGPE
ncbi:MAG TPA: DUF1080 domain-containing protein [Armatimonadota bacterium]|nr:DUF1080 domain-containing protein [Armatimonadota bacterium]